MVEDILSIEKWQIRDKDVLDFSSGINCISFTNTKKYCKTAAVSRS